MKEEITKKEFEKKKKINLPETIYKIYKENPDKAFTTRAIRKKILEETGIEISANMISGIHSIWSFKGILLHNRPYYVINLKSKAKPNWTKEDKRIDRRKK